MKGLILAAGLGTRLMPLTATKPKALVEVNGVPLLEIAIRKLARAGFTDIIVNVHHHAGMVIEYLKNQSFPGVNIAISDETGELLDTGGAILHAQWFLDGKEPFLVHNVDVISDVNLQTLAEAHLKNDGLATLSVGERQTSRYFLFDNSMKLVGWKDISKDVTRWADKPVELAKPLAFSGIHIISPEIFHLFEEKGKFSVIDTYLRLAKNHPVYGYVHQGKTWFDLGKPDQLASVSQFLAAHPQFIFNS
jgi:N-acetyl-alpha-D-muramate 1-phosphate uridylyltransferase